MVWIFFLWIWKWLVIVIFCMCINKGMILQTSQCPCRVHFAQCFEHEKALCSMGAAFVEFNYKRERMNIFWVIWIVFDLYTQFHWFSSFYNSRWNMDPPLQTRNENQLCKKVGRSRCKWNKLHLLKKSWLWFSEIHIMWCLYLEKSRISMRQ